VSEHSNALHLEQLASSRWRRILGDGWVGQQSFVHCEDVLGSVLRLQSGDLLLDVGCGSGHLCTWLTQNLGCDVVGLDVSLGVKRAPPETHFVTASCDALPFSLASTFDGLISLDALQHALRPTEVLRNLVEHVDPDGPVLVTAWITQRQDLRNGWNFGGLCELAELESISSELGLALTLDDQFLQRLRAQEAGLNEHAEAYIALWGKATFELRASLEQASVLACAMGDLSQVRLIRG
jgi:SAM-dependent methyltransferase